MNINHVHLKAKNIEELSEFYQKYFGFIVLERNSVEVYLGNIKGSWLTLSQAQPDDTSLPEWFHFGFCLTTNGEVRDLYQRLKADDLTFPRELTEFGESGTTFYVLDPESNKIEVSWIRSHQGP